MNYEAEQARIAALKNDPATTHRAVLTARELLSTLFAFRVTAAAECPSDAQLLKAVDDLTALLPAQKDRA